MANEIRVGARRLPDDLLASLLARVPSLWLNPSLGAALPAGAPTASDVAEAEDRFRRCGDLLARLFPELGPGAAIVESELIPVPCLQAQGGSDPGHDGTWLVKCDHALPVAGSIKARGGLHEILALAERIAREAGLLAEDDDRLRLADPDLRALFSRHTIAVGSTGNLGLSIGTAAAALGFATEVHMSVDAKAWKKARLRARGVAVIEHAGDYAAAVAAGRAAADGRCRHFVDDERSPMLFLGYAAAARHLSRQLAALGRRVDADHPLFVYLPCGVGGGPGGVTYGLKQLYGDAVHCFFAEPVAAPCMLVQLAAGTDAPVSVYDIGLDNRTEADGLAVGLASPFVSPLMACQLSGVFTVADDRLFMDLARIAEAEGIEIEPSAAAGIGGPDWLTRSDPGRAYLRRHGLDARMANATHVVWTTGGSLVPPPERAAFRARGLRLLARSESARSEPAWREEVRAGRSRPDLEHA